MYEYKYGAWFGYTIKIIVIFYERPARRKLNCTDIPAAVNI